MRIPYSGFVGGTGALRSPQIGVTRSVNLYPELLPGDGKVRGWLKGTPGLVQFADCGIGPIRALFYEDTRCFAIAAQYLYEVFSDGSAIRRGEVINDGRKATIVSNGNIARQLFIVSGLNGYIFDLATQTLTRITDVDFPSALVGAFADSYFLALWSGVPKFSYSGLANGNAWDALDIAQKSKTSDGVLTMAYHAPDLRLLGSKTTEIWTNTGDADNPWSPSGIILNYGIHAVDSLAQGFDALFWLTHAKEVVRSSGYGVVPIGSQALHTAIASYGRTDDAIGWCQDEEGHKFYWLTFPTAGKTWVYDLMTQEWHERLSFSNGEWGAHLGRCYELAFDRHLIGSRVDGKIYRLSYDAYDDAGAVLKRLRVAPHVHQSAYDFEHNRLTLDMHVGYALATGQGSSPVVMMRYSDGGETWSDERMASLGGNGQYGTQVYWDRCGQSRNRVYEVSWTDPLYTGINDAFLDVERLAA